MKILYGLSGEGLGHSSRAELVVSYLEKKGHKIKIVTYGQAIGVLKKKGFDVFEIKGMHFIFENGRIRRRKTLKKALKDFSLNIKKRKEIKELMKEKFDLCISDMEPLTTILSKMYKIPLISFDNQHILVNAKLKIPKKYYMDFKFAKLITKYFAFNAKYYIITHIGNAEIKKRYKNKTFIVSPIIRPKVKNLKPEKKDFILIYLTNYSEQKDIIKILRQVNQKFILYGANTQKNYKNIIFKEKGDGFLQDLKKCKAVIATAGFSLISEALYLKKPYFAIPVKAQFEQTFNALLIKKIGFGDYFEELKKEEIENFLSNLWKYEENLEKYTPDYNLVFDVFDEVFKKIESN